MSDLGKSLLKKKSKKQSRHTDPHRPQNASSVTNRSDLEEFLAVSELANKSFDSDHTLKFKSTGDSSRSKDLSSYKEWLRLPRRPRWTQETTYEQLQKLENEAFLEWRRHLAQIENNDSFAITPFERNLELWRQLWRVLEMSEVIIQIVDARNPLLFYCEDLFKYAMELPGDKKCILLINKADLLNEWLLYHFSHFFRKSWSDYFADRKIDAIFYSAISEDSGLHKMIFSSEKLMQIASKNAKVVGFVGYPNVGKSSTINSILKRKCTSVSMTPGKTKHYQSFILDDGTKIVDCPGLVFPNVVHSKDELVINGILPIDQMKDYLSPVRAMIKTLRQDDLEHFYKFSLTSFKKPMQDSDLENLSFELLDKYATVKGFRTSVVGNPDQSRAARLILKDYVSGRLLFCNTPPSI